MYTSKDYNYQTTISRLEARIKIAASGASDIERGLKILRDKHNMADTDIDSIMDGIGDLCFYLEQK